MNNCILVIEDMPDYQKMIFAALSFKYEVDIASSLEQARVKLQKKQYTLILLDIMLPDGSGLDFCREVQTLNDGDDTPIILLTAKESISDKVLGFSLGVEDYITKPFNSIELLARVDSKVVKYLKKKQGQELFKKGALRFDIQGFGLYAVVGDDEKKVDVTPIEFKILLRLAQNANRTISRNQLLESVWGSEIYVEDRCVDKHISAIRKKLIPHEKYIQTVSGVGYEFKI